MRFAEVWKGEMMDELISRREAIKVVRASCHWDYPWASKSPKDIMADAVNALKELPSAQPEIKTGRWICEDTGLMVTEYKCSECGRIVRDDTGYDVYLDHPYCHCGAKMLKTKN